MFSCTHFCTEQVLCSEISAFIKNKFQSFKKKTCEHKAIFIRETNAKVKIISDNIGFGQNNASIDVTKIDNCYGP